MDGNYRLGWAGGILTVSNSVINSGTLIIGGTAGNLNPLTGLGDNLGTAGSVILSTANSYSGGTVIDPYSTLTGTAQASGSPFGSSTGTMVLHDASLALANSGTTATTTTVGAFSFDGNSKITVTGTTLGSNTLALGAITRNSNGTLTIAPAGTGGVLGTTSVVTTTSTLATTTVATGSSGQTAAMVAPYFFDASGDYLTYGGSGTGFSAITTALTTPQGAPINAYVKTSGSATLTSSGTIAALSIGASGTVAPTNQPFLTNTSGAAVTLQITTGGLTSAGNQPPRIPA